MTELTESNLAIITKYPLNDNLDYPQDGLLRTKHFFASSMPLQDDIITYTKEVP